VDQRHPHRHDPPLNAATHDNPVVRSASQDEICSLLPGGSAHHHNPPGTFERQASRMLDLLNSD
jgi:hypothetical protein